MKFYKNEEHDDLLIVEGERCVLHYLFNSKYLIKVALRAGLDSMYDYGETLDDMRDLDQPDETYRQLIESGFYTEFTPE